ncbi:EAL domain-containing protein [Congregibacter sp.]|uniref:EAL domain-containing protein n=1 Tax=Congregibacter sp. TaxID=2744308 RepID=UPI003F6B54AB
MRASSKTSGPDAHNISMQVFDALSVGVAIYEPVDDGDDFRIVSMNAAALRISQVKEAAVLGRLLSEAFPGAIDAGVFDALCRVRRNGEREFLPAIHYEDSERRGWYRNELSCLPDGNIMAEYVDVTDDVVARASLAESETRYQLLTESMADGIYDWDIVTGKMYFSPAWKAQLGYADHEFENALETWERILHPDQSDAVLSDLQEFINNDIAIWDRQFQLRHKAGHYVWIHSRGTPLRDPNTHKAHRLVGVHMDIDREKAQEQEVARQRSVTDALLNAMPDLVFLVDDESRILFYQSANSDDLYTAPEDFVGERMSDVLPPEIGPKVQEALSKAVVTRSLVTLEYALPIKGESQQFECRISSTEEGRAALIARNITARKHAEESLQERLKELRGLYEIYHCTQSETDLDTLAPVVARQLVASMQSSQSVLSKVTVDSRVWEMGEGNGDGEVLTAPLVAAGKRRGSLEISFNAATAPVEEEAEFLKGAATALGLWLQNSQSWSEARILEKMLGSTDSQVALVDSNFRYVLANTAYADRLGQEPTDLVGHKLSAVLGDEYEISALEGKHAKALAGETVHFQEWRDSPQGPCYLDIVYAPYRDADGLHGVAVSIHDITSLYEAEAQLRRAAQAFSSSAEAIIMTSVDTLIIDVNEAFTQITGYERDDALGHSLQMLLSDLHAPQFFQEMLSVIEREGRWQGEIWSNHRNGRVFPCWMTMSQVKSPHGENDGYVGVLADITIIKENEQRLEVLAHQDALTGLPNRNQLIRSMDSRIGRSATEHQPFIVMFIDLDQFKNVNDTLGHSAGDRLLREASQRLQHLLRDEDLLARLGGDEFVAVLPGVRSRQNASIIATKIIDALTAPFSIDGQRVQVSASIGICCYPEDGSSSETLLRNADTAMYKAKAAGRSTWCGYSQEMTAEATRHMLLSGALRDAVSAGELELVYQPKFHVDSLELSGFEALSRWNHPEFGAIPPSEFIVIAENSGLISELDNLVLRAVCRQIKLWRGAGLEPPPVAVNVSGNSLQQVTFFESVSEVLQAEAINGDWLGLELTETALLPRPEEQSSVLDALRELGLGIAVDDFGTGYSSLSYLQQLPVTQLKIDASFVRHVASSDDAAAIAETIIAMARALKVGIVAEGVETEEQAAFLRERGPMQVQGFLYSEGLLPDEAAKLLRS